MGLFDIFSTPGPTTTQTQSADSFATPYWQQYLQGVGNLAGNTNFSPYAGPTVAPQNFMQNTANDMMYNLATGGSPAGNMANSAIVAQASGANLANPYATTLNPYMGSDPYTQQVINSTNDNMAQAYQTGTAAQNDAMFNQANAFGGSAYQNQTALNNKAFANAVGNVDSNLLNQNYYNNANLAENAINRGTQSYQNALQQQLQAANSGLASQGVDMNAINGLYGLGQQQQQYGQNVLNAGANYYTQNQMAPFMPYDLFGTALTNYSNANHVTTNQGPASSGIANLVGGVGAGYTLFGPGGLFPIFGGSSQQPMQPMQPYNPSYGTMQPFNPQPLP